MFTPSNNSERVYKYIFDEFFHWLRTKCKKQRSDNWPSWPMVPCELCQQHYQPSHQDSLCGQNLSISLSVKVKRGIFLFYKSSNKNSISINMWEYVYFRCTPDTPAQLAMWCRVAKTLHAQPGAHKFKGYIRSFCKKHHWENSQRFWNWHFGPWKHVWHAFIMRWIPTFIVYCFLKPMDMTCWLFIACLKTPLWLESR